MSRGDEPSSTIAFGGHRFASLRDLTPLHATPEPGHRIRVALAVVIALGIQQSDSTNAVVVT